MKPVPRPSGLRGLVPLALLPAALAGCNALPPFACTQELGIEIRPRERTVRAGESFTAEAIGTSCGGRERFPYAVGWRASDTLVVRVDAATGRVTGLRPGVARVEAHEKDASWSLGFVAVTVRP